jgi:serine phosphatase RsbU (regulator of sigma subunit)
VTSSSWLISALVIGGVGYLSLAGFVWANRQGVGSRPLIVMLLAVKVWSLCYALELSSRSVEVAQWWSALKYVGIVALPPALWSFVLAYTGRGKLPRPVFGLLLIHPVLLLTLLAVPATHDLIQVYPSDPAKLHHLLGAPIPDTGKYFWVHAVYVYVTMLSADFTLLARLARIAPPYRRQGYLLVVASLLPFFGNVVFNLGLFGNDVIDPTPFLFGITGVVLVWGFFWLRLLDLTPVARGLVIEQMADGVLVLDVYGRVADANAAGTAIVGIPRRSMVGRNVVDIIPGLASILEKADVDPSAVTLESEVLIYPTAVPLALGTSPNPAVAALPSGLPTSDYPQRIIDPPRDVAVSLTAVTDPIGRQIARLVVLRDVTERNRTERQVRDLLAEQTKLSETLRQSLRPASLPQLPGLSLAARSIPSARGGGVGGDFYDVHSAGKGVSAFVLGDVSGKGVHAAVVTSMARYTVRTLSAQGWTPREVLQQLNRALQTSDDLERFCTVVYGQVHPASTVIDLRETSASRQKSRTWAAEPILAQYPSPPDESGRRAGKPSGVRLVLTLGGHPPPLVRRRDRSVHPVGTPGTVLGLLPEIEVHEVIVDLASGDVLLAYTDGVTEARDGDELFGEERLAGVLAAVEHEYSPTPGGDSAEQSAVQLADAVADAVLAAVRAFSSERDDVALLVLAAT